ncbi:zinc-ribbon domain-containing protein [Butyrivibrio sp. VCB2006]|uniref:zinc-ribbon domain-containing protein n=1 Tax=Butyrivibrio sp. VCB2006 TaxID=1280679 RepID=UPI000492C441|nr:zinc ribbon domain-containing protein [Butyrivibrio sp. VCB2006]
MGKFCINCGTELTESAKFCPKCGKALTPENYPTKLSILPKTTTASEVFTPNLSPTKTNKNKSWLSITLASVMAVELVVVGFIRPGYFIKRNDTSNKKQYDVVTDNTDNIVQHNDSENLDYSEFDLKTSMGTSLAGTVGHDWEPDEEDITNYTVIDNLTPEVVAFGTLTEDSLSIVSSDGASMTIDPCFLDKDTKAEILRVPGTVDYRVGDYTVPLTLYEFHAEGISDDTYMTLEIPIQKTIDGDIGAGYYDASTGTIWPVNFEYDETKQVVRIRATHLSGYCGFPIDNPGTRKAMLGFMDHGDGLERLMGSGNSDLIKDVEMLEKSVNAGDSWEAADSLVNELDEWSTHIGTVASGLEVVGDIEEGLSLSDGAGKTIVKNSYGTVGEIMNTMWGKSGSWGTSKRYGGPVTVTEIEDKLKSTYPADTIKKIGKGMNIMSTSISIYKILEHGRKGDTKAAVWESVKLSFDKVMSAVGNKISLPSMGVYLIGVSLFAYALDTIYSDVIEGRKQVYMKAYTEYYDSRETDGGYRSAAKWRQIFTEIMKSGGGMKEVDEEIDKYVNQFWVHANQFDSSYLVNIMTEDEKAAWGVSGQGGLNKEIKEEISRNYKAELKPYIKNILRVMNEKNEDEVLETYMAQYESLRREMNQVISLKIIDGTKEEGKDSDYAGCIVRFKGLKGKVTDPKSWETILDSKGQGEIKVTFLAHMLVNAGTTLEVVQIDHDKETIVLEQSFKMKLPNNRIILEFPEPTGAEWANGYWSINQNSECDISLNIVDFNKITFKFVPYNNLQNWNIEATLDYSYDTKNKVIKAKGKLNPNNDHLTTLTFTYISEDTITWSMDSSDGELLYRFK